MNPSRSRRIAALLLSSGVLFAAAGCQVDQQAEVAKYREVLDSRVPDPGPYAAGEPLSLAKAMALANRNNEQLGLRGEEYLQALIQKNRIVANFLPTVSLQPSFTLEQRAVGDAATSTGPGGTGIGTGGTGSGTGTTNTGAAAGGGGFRSSGDVSYRTEVPVVGNINLYRGGADVANLQSADANIERFRYQLQDAQATVLLNVAQVYLTVLRSERAVEVLRNSLALQEARLRDVTQQQKNQLATQLTVSQTQAQVSGTRAGLVQAEGDVRNGRHTLALLIGTDGLTGPLSEQSAADAATGPLGDLLYYERQALDTREDLRAAAAAVRSARAQVDVSVAQYYPSVSLNVAGFLYREFYGDASKWNAVLSANLPIFSAGIIEADVRAAWSRLRQAALNESYLRRQVLTDVRQAYQNVATADRKAAEYEQQVRAAGEALKQSRDAQANGLAINLDVLVAQDQVLNAELQLTGTRFDRTVYYLDLVRATGRLQEVTAAALARPTTGPTTTPTTRP